MAKKVVVSIYNNANDRQEWECENEMSFETLWDLKYGENPQQKALLFKSDNMADYEVINDRILSYNEILSITELSNILSEFYDVCAVAIVAHAAPCGVALAPTLEEAYNKAFDCDPMASFFGIIGSSQKINYEVAKHINSMSVRLVIAPDYEVKALKLLKDNPNIKIVKLNTPLKDFQSLIQKNIHVTPFGTLYQDMNRSSLGKNSFNVATRIKPTKEQIEDAVFAWKVSKHSRSNSVVIAKDFKTVAIAQGFVSPVNAAEAAMKVACDASKHAVMASDNVLPTIDCLSVAAQGRISVIIQPGGAKNEDKIIELADKFHIVVILTGIRNYKH